MVHISFRQQPGDFIIVRPIVLYVVNRITEYRSEIFHVLRVIGLGEALSFFVQAVGVQRAGAAANEQLGTGRFAITHPQDQSLRTIAEKL